MYKRQHQRLPEPYIELNVVDAERAGVGAGDRVALRVNGHDWEMATRVSTSPPEGVILFPRSLAGPLLPRTMVASLRKLESWGPCTGLWLNLV